jgi:hypothetical protein
MITFTTFDTLTFKYNQYFGLGLGLISVAL